MESHSLASCRLINVSPLFCLVSAVQGAYRRVHEELEASKPAVKILQDVFGEWTKATGTEDEARTTEPVKSEWHLGFQTSARILSGSWRYYACGASKRRRKNIVLVTAEPRERLTRKRNVSLSKLTWSQSLSVIYFCFLRLRLWIKEFKQRKLRYHVECLRLEKSFILVITCKMGGHQGGDELATHWKIIWPRI